MKKSFIFLCCILVFTVTPVLASNNYDTNGSRYTETTDGQKLLLNASHSTPFLARGGFSERWLSNYPNFKQDTIYNCGPASVKQALHHINDSSLTQSTYGTSMGTNSSTGTNVQKIVDELNLRQSKNKYGWRILGNTDVWELWNIVTTDINMNVPVIIRLNASLLPRYNNYYKPIWHYITIIGYRDSHSGPQDNVYYYMDTYEANYGNGSTLGESGVLMYDLFNIMKNQYVMW